jgi:capsular polysaccharide transport system ATP-binding protein
LIEIVNLSKYYPTPKGAHYVFRDLNFTFPEGVSVALMGRNGAGKSTLLSIIAGTESPNSGYVRTNKTMSWRLGSSGGFQGSLTPRDNIRFVCRVFNCSPEETREKIAFVEEFAEIGKFFDLPMRTLSGGMKGRVTFGVSMSFDFDYFIIDEGMSAGDPIFKKKVPAVLKARLEKSNVIITTHNTKEVESLCQMVVVLENGQATLYEDVKEGLDVYLNMERQKKAIVK